MSEPGTDIREIEFKNFLEEIIGKSYTESALLWFKKNLQNIVTSDELARIPGRDGKPISHNMRRIFELRDEKGFEIINHKDKINGFKLKIDQWVLLNNEPNKNKIRSRGVTTKIRALVLARDMFTCQTCGRINGDDDPFKSGHMITLHIGHISAHKNTDGSISNVGKELTPDDFITQCNVCNEGYKNSEVIRISLIDRVKAASLKDKMEIYEVLKKDLG